MRWEMHLLRWAALAFENKAVEFAVRIEQELRDLTDGFGQAGGIDPMHGVYSFE